MQHHQQQRNSLNIQLKSNYQHHQQQQQQQQFSSGTTTSGGKRPLSQDTIIEMNNETPTAYLSSNNNNVSINNTLEQMAMELENARNRISSLNNQLNSNVRIALFNEIYEIFWK
jgi:hypothetical protein